MGLWYSDVLSADVWLKEFINRRKLPTTVKQILRIMDDSKRMKFS